MPKTVRIPKLLQSLTNNEEFVEVSASTIGDLIVELQKRFPGITEHLLDEKGQIRRFANFYVNSEDIRFMNNSETQLKEGDRVDIIPALIEMNTAAVAIDVANRLRLEQQSRKN